MPDPSRSRTSVLSPAIVVVVVAMLLAAGCSTDDPSAAAGAGATAVTTTTTTAPAWQAPDCDLGADRSVPASEPVAGVASDLTLTSFDDTRLRIHWFPTAATDEPAPTVLMGPGWGLSGDTSTGGATLFGALGIGDMNAAGYNVLTWDPRGFGKSTGTATVNDPEHEGRDAQALLDWVASRPEAQLDADGDPRAGMVGWSYGGGIQLTLAALDCRVDALVPGLAWHSLTTSLYAAETVKTGWAGVLSSVSELGTLDPHIPSARASGDATGTLSDDDADWFASRGPGELVARIDVPTLLVQGTVDTLFTLAEAVTNHRILSERGVPTAMLWFCGGHGSCLTKPGDATSVTRRSLAWLDRYLAHDDSVAVGPTLDVVDQDGARWTADRYPTDDDLTTVSGTGTGTLDLDADPQPAPFRPPAGTSDVLTGLVSGITPTRAGHAVEVGIDPGEVDGLALGAPTLRLTYSGTVEEGPRPTRVFAQLVDDATGIVLGNQVTPIAVELDGENHQVTVPLEVVAHHLVPGQRITLQLIAASSAYAATNRAGSIAFDDIAIDLPVAPDVQRAP